MAVSLGINPITWTNDDMPELGGDIPLETCLAETRLAGYAGIELGGKFPRDAAHAATDPGAASACASCRAGTARSSPVARAEAEIAAVAPHLELLAAMGCTAMVFAEGHGSTDGDPAAPLSRRPVLPDAAWPEFCAKLNAVARHLKQRGVRLAFHHHMGTVVQTEAEIDRLMAGTDDDVGLLLDTGHLVFAGGDPVAVARRHGARIAHVHCKDVRAAVLADVLRDDRSFLRAVLDSVFTVPGDGSIDFAAVLRALRPFGYCGLAGGRGGAGSGQGASADLCAPGLRQPEARRRGGRVRRRGGLSRTCPTSVDGACIDRILSGRRRLHRTAARREHRRPSVGTARLGRRSRPRRRGQARGASTARGPRRASTPRWPILPSAP